MSGHDGQPIPKLVGHVLHLLGHATESCCVQSMLVHLGVLVGCTRKPQTRSISLTTGTRADFTQQLHFDFCVWQALVIE